MTSHWHMLGEVIFFWGQTAKWPLANRPRSANNRAFHL